MTKDMTVSDIFVGVNGTGKSTFAHQIARQEVAAGGRALIVTPHEDEWTQYANITSRQQLHDFTGIRRMFCVPEKKFAKELFDGILQHYKYGLLILDDARIYIQANVGETINRLMISRRQLKLNIITMFHGLTQVPPAYFTYCSRLVLWNTIDNIDRKKNVIPEEIITAVEQAKRRIGTRCQQNPYYKECIVIDRRFSSINM